MTYKPNIKDLTKEGCISYLENWVSILEEQIDEKSEKPESLLLKEQIDFLTKTIEELKRNLQYKHHVSNFDMTLITNWIACNNKIEEIQKDLDSINRIRYGEFSLKDIQRMGKYFNNGVVRTTIDSLLNHLESQLNGYKKKQKMIEKTLDKKGIQVRPI